MNNVSASIIEKATCKEKRKQLNEFYQTVAAFRPALFKYCRRLTNSPWEAEDLAQETLMVAYGRLADKHAGIQNLQSYLFKVATNQWITWCRRGATFSGLDPKLSGEAAYEIDIYAAKDSLGALMRHLPPKERVAFVLSEVFESKNEEIAEIMGTTEGAVKSALVRAREKVKNLESKNRKKVEAAHPEHEKILGLAVQAFNRRDLEGFAKLFAGNAISMAPGCFFETGIEEIKKGSLFYTINSHEGTPQPESMKAELVKIGGELFFGLFSEERLDDIWKFTIEESEIVRFDCYYCCPDVLAEVASILNKPANNHGYWFEQHLANV